MHVEIGTRQGNVTVTAAAYQRAQHRQRAIFLSICEFSRVDVLSYAHHCRKHSLTANPDQLARCMRNPKSEPVAEQGPKAA